MKTIHLTKQAGSSLVIVLTVLATLMVIVAVAADYTGTVNRHVQRSNTIQNAVAVGDSAIEVLFANWRARCSDPLNVNTPLTTDHFDGTIGAAMPTPSAAQLNLASATVKRGTNFDPNIDEYDPAYTISNYKVVGTNAEWGTVLTAASTPEPMLGQLPGAITGPSPSTSLIYNYMASADVRLPALGKNGEVVAKVRRVFQKQQISPWSFAIFYVDPLEIHPGPDFTVTGWVHSNSDIYTAHESLTFADKVTYAGSWFIDYKPGDGQHPIPPLPQSPHYPSDLPPARDQALQPFGLDSTSIFNTTDTNPNNDSYRELIEPPSASPDPLQNTRYWDQASVIIKISDTPSANTVTIGTPHFNALTQRYDGTIDVLSTSSSLYTMFNPAITTGTTINDQREALTNPTRGTVRLATLDINQILNNTSGLTPTYKSSNFNGIVYIYDSTATSGLNANGTVNTSAVKRGIRLKNGSKIPSSGLTVVSNNPVYVQGDFNTGATGASVPSNVSGSYGDPANPPNPQVTGYTRAPCSILADAVTITSSGWAGLSGALDASGNTTVNAAIISGIVPTSPVGGDGAYSGGAENFPRFLENWSGEMLTYYGSMVQLFNSNQSVGKWSGSNTVYSPPDRQWFFDNNFKIKPPPGSIMVYSYVKGKWSILPN